MSRSGTMAKMNGTSGNAKNAQQQSVNNIWQLMNYSIPRGKCVHKPSMLSPSCPCLRFMLNPLQAASSFACDGCSHHASFHNLKGPEDDEGYTVFPEGASLAVRQNGKGGNGRKRSATMATVGENRCIATRNERQLQIANSRDEASVVLSDDDSGTPPVGKRVRS